MITMVSPRCKVTVVVPVALCPLLQMLHLWACVVWIDLGDAAIGHFPVELAVAGERVWDAFFSVVFDGFGDGFVADSFEVEDFFPKSIHFFFSHGLTPFMKPENLSGFEISWPV